MDENHANGESPEMLPSESAEIDPEQVVRPLIYGEPESQSEPSDDGGQGSSKKGAKKKKKKDKKEEKVTVSFASNAFELISVFVSALVVIAVFFIFVVRPVGVNGTSMLPTLQSGDWLLVSPLYSQPEYGDIIVSYPPSAFDEPLIKRVIAVGGQKVDIDFDTGIVYVDDVALDEVAYVNTPTTRRTEYDQQFPLYVPYGYVFMCGDNRNGSTDSRSTLVGFCREEYILGKAIGRIVPFGSWDIYESFRTATGGN